MNLTAGDIVVTYYLNTIYTTARTHHIYCFYLHKNTGGLFILVRTINNSCCHSRADEWRRTVPRVTYATTTANSGETRGGKRDTETSHDDRSAGLKQTGLFIRCLNRYTRAHLCVNVKSHARARARAFKDMQRTRHGDYTK